MTAAQVWDDLEGTDLLGRAIAEDLRGIAVRYESGLERSRQKALGPSQIGMACTRCLARYVLGVPVRMSTDDPWARIIGTAVHSWLDEAAQAEVVRINRARWLSELRVYPDGKDSPLLPKGGRCDLYDTDRRTVIDHKIVGITQLRKYRTNGPGAQYRYQGHLYGLGWALEGWPVEHVAVAFWPRGGRLPELYVWNEPYSPAVAHEAIDRFRTIRDQALALGPAIIPHLPADPDCWDCEGQDGPLPLQRDAVVA